MRKELAAQLEEFLEKGIRLSTPLNFPPLTSVLEVPSFIDTLFTVLRTKSYLPYTTSPPPSQPSSSNPLPTDAGIPIPLDSFLSNNAPSPERRPKRTHVDEVHDAVRPAKGPRLTVDGQFSRYSSGRDTRSTGQWAPRTDRQGSANGIGPAVLNGQRIQTYQPPDQRRGVCRDYHSMYPSVARSRFTQHRYLDNGYCARGALCKYSHGDDAFVPSQLFAMGSQGGPIPFLPMFPNGVMPFGMVGPGATYDPHEARMDMRPSGNMMGINGRAPPRPPVLSRVQEDNSQTARTSGELPVIQDLTPQIPEDPSTTSSQPPPPQDGASWMQSAPLPQQPEVMDVDAAASSQHIRTGSGAARGGFRGEGRGTFSGDAQSFRPERRNDKTLVVEKIPEDKLSLDAVNSWFKRFGTVTNVAIDARTAKALVSFSDHNEAHAAWKSEDAVFGNRFVKVFWHRPMEGRGQKGTRMLAASAPLVANIGARSAIPTTPPTSTSTTIAARKSMVASNAAAELAAKQKLLEEQIAEQKSLMASLTTASGEEKKTIMTRLRKLGEEMKPSSSPPSIPGEASSHSASTTQRAGNSAEHLSQHDKERDRLDKELDLHAVTDNESTAELQAKLAKLKEEVRVCIYICDTSAKSVSRPQTWAFPKVEIILMLEDRTVLTGAVVVERAAHSFGVPGEVPLVVA